MIPRTSRRYAVPRAAVIAAALLLAGCSGDSDPGPGGVTKGEARALDEAAASLDARPHAPLIDATAPAEALAQGTEAAP